MVKSRTGSLTHTAHATMPNQSAFGRGARVLATFAAPADLSVPSAPQRASCSLGTTSPTSATFRATSCAAMGGASRAPGSATGCPTVLTRATRRNAVSVGPCGAGTGVGQGAGARGRGCWGAGAAEEAPSVTPCGGRGAAGQQSCPLLTQARPQRSMACAETGVLVGMEPQLWESRGPLHQSLLTLTLRDCHCLHFAHEESEPQRLCSCCNIYQPRSSRPGLEPRAA